jgi:hypothetical protein
LFLYFYQICLAVFFVQGVTIPLIVLFSGILWWNQNRRLQYLEKLLERIRRKGTSGSTDISKLLDHLPKLEPLKCISCGAGVLLREADTFCPYCKLPGPMPKDYAPAVSLKQQIGPLVRSAVRHWGAANVLTFPLVRWAFFLLIFAGPFVVFPTVAIGANIYRDTWFDRMITAAGESMTLVVMIPSFLGVFIWMVVFIFIYRLCKDLRSSLPAYPVLERAADGTETAECEACGGGISYAGSDFACVCPYCNVENYRTRFVRTERKGLERKKTDVHSVTFAAMRIIDDFIGGFFFTLLILAVAASLLVVFAWFKNLG